MLASSVWLTLGPALIAGGIGFVSAMLSFLMARIALNQSHEESERNRRHERDLLLWEKRGTAAERAWRILYLLESTGALDTARREELVTVVMWLPTFAQEAALQLANRLAQGDSALECADLIAAIRRALLNEVAISSDGSVPA